MKNLILILIFGFQFVATFAQQAPPQGISYQAVVYAPINNQQAGVNISGQQPATKQQVLIKFTLEEGFNGSLIYEETHTDTTDEFGLLNTIIGTGTPTSNSPGLFNQIDWSQGNPYLRVDITLSQYSTTVTSYQKLWSVPYALYAGQANTADSAAISAFADSSDYANMAGNGITDVIDNGNGTLTFNYFDGSSYTTGPLTGVGSLGAINEWKLSGNAGTDPSSNFIGTIDSVDWVIRTDSIERVRVTATGLVGIGTANPVSVLHTKGTETVESIGSNSVTYQIVDANSTPRYTERFNFNNTNSQLDINLISPDSLGELSVRYFRNTSSNAPKYIAFFRGNGLFDLSAKIGVDGQTSYFQKHGGNFGIGTSNPSSSLHVKGMYTSQLSNSQPNYFYKLIDSTGVMRFSQRLNYDMSYSQIDNDIFSPDNQGQVSFRYFANTNTTGTKYVSFFRGNGSAISSQISARIGVDGGNSYFQNHGGNFGIGTSNPTSNLQVIGVSKFGQTGQFNISMNMDTLNLLNALIPLNSYGTGLIEAPKQSNLAIRIQGNHWDDGFFVITGPDNVLSSGPSDKIPFKVLRNGWVGVGKSKPQNTFHVNNDVLGADSSFIVTEFGNVGIGKSNPTEKLEIENGGIRINGFYGVGFTDQPFGNNTPNVNEGAKIYFDNTILPDPNRDYLVLEKKDGSSINPDGGIVFANRGNNGVRTPNMIIDGLGQVGIGTITPARTLHVNSVMRLEPIPTPPSSPAKGDMYFDSTINKLRVYDGTTWQNCW